MAAQNIFLKSDFIIAHFLREKKIFFPIFGIFSAKGQFWDYAEGIMNYGLEYAQYQRDRAEPPDIFVKPQSQKFYRKKVKRKTDSFLRDKKR